MDISELDTIMHNEDSSPAVREGARHELQRRIDEAAMPATKEGGQVSEDDDGNMDIDIGEGELQGGKDKGKPGKLQGGKGVENDGKGGKGGKDGVVENDGKGGGKGGKGDGVVENDDGKGGA